MLLVVMLVTTVIITTVPTTPTIVVIVPATPDSHRVSLANNDSLAHMSSSIPSAVPMPRGGMVVVTWGIVIITVLATPIITPPIIMVTHALVVAKRPEDIAKQVVPRGVPMIRQSGKRKRNGDTCHKKENQNKSSVHTPLHTVSPNQSIQLFLKMKSPTRLKISWGKRADQSRHSLCACSAKLFRWCDRYALAYPVSPACTIARVRCASDEAHRTACASMAKFATFAIAGALVRTCNELIPPAHPVRSVAEITKMIFLLTTTSSASAHTLAETLCSHGVPSSVCTFARIGVGTEPLLALTIARSASNEFFHCR